MVMIPRFVCTLLLTIGVLFWIRSYHFAEGIEVIGRGHSILITSTPGRIHACWPSPVLLPLIDARARVHGQRFLVSASSTPRSVQLSAQPGTPSALEKPTWLSPFFRDVTPQNTSIVIAVWLLVLSVGAWPAWAIIKNLRRRRRNWFGTLCRKCEYDLRASPDRCPECGTVVRAPSLRRQCSALLLGAAVVTILLAGGRWLTRHDFRSGNCWAMDLATLGGFQLDQEHGTLAEIPLSLRQLDGQRISLEGYMIPLDQVEEIHDFVLVTTLFTSFKSPALIQQSVVAHVIPGNATGYLPGRLRIDGTLHVRVVTDDGYLCSVYEMTVDSVKSVPDGE